MTNPSRTRIRQNQLRLPLLQLLDAHPDGLPTSKAVTALADALRLEPAQRDTLVPLPGGGEVNAFARDVRWVRQQAKEAGQLDGSVRGLWRITPRGQHDLLNARPGVVITVFETRAGRALWADAAEALGSVKDDSVNLWVTSPPYPLESKKTYGNFQGDEYLEWLTAISRELHRTLTPDGSLFLNLGDTWQRGRPVLSLYQERLLLTLCDQLGFRLAQRLVWHNPSRLPGPAEWVTVRRCRLTTATEQLYWLSKTDHPKADNRQVLRPYSASMVRRQQTGGETGAARPSGHQIRSGSFADDNGGSIAHNVITQPHSASNDTYLRYCRENRLAIHPARFPQALAELPIRLCTNKGDLVGDPFAGSCTTAAVAESLERRWLAIERSFTYLQGAVARFNQPTLLPVA